MRENYAAICDELFLRDLVLHVVLAAKGKLQVDWTEPHRVDVKSAVKRLLHRRSLKPEDFEGLTNAVMRQAAALRKNWSGVAGASRPAFCLGGLAINRSMCGAGAVMPSP